MKEVKVLVFALAFGVICCQTRNTSESSHLQDTGDTLSYYVPSDSGAFYFPSGTFRDTSSYEGHDTFMNTWFSKHLFAMREPVIFKDKSPREIYRFTWLRTFHHPIAIRIEKNGDRYFLYWKLCNGAGGYSPGKLTIDKQKEIDPNTWKEFKQHLDEIGFWELPTNPDRNLGLDGSEWIFEGKVLNQYHVVQRWTPDEDTKYYKCGDYLIQLTDLTIPKEDKY